LQNNGNNFGLFVGYFLLILEKQGHNKKIITISLTVHYTVCIHDMLLVDLCITR
jgi:hypothetical protein